jgi:hypothetical protein
MEVDLGIVENCNMSFTPGILKGQKLVSIGEK